MKHSQRTNAKPLDAWVIIKKDGSASSGHCTCMAGNSEVCSHIASLLFAAEYANTKKSAMSCTDLPALWPMPSLSTEVPIVPITQMDFGKVVSSESSARQLRAVSIPKMGKNGVIDLLTRIEKLDRTAGLMRIVQPFAGKIQLASAEILQSIFNIFEEKNISKSHRELMEIAKTLKFNLTQEEATKIETLTRAQHASDNWYIQRAGRITASKFKGVCSTKKESPSLSLIKMICYPVKSLFRTKATEWGLEHETEAANEYLQIMEEEHIDIIVNDVGLIVNPRWPEFGASPDRLVFCECCLGGVLEIKCPYSLYANDINDLKEYCKQKSPCVMLNNGEIVLKRNHAYYYQIQMQMFVANLQYGDFVIWSPKIFFKERIFPDFKFWEQNSKIAQKFHQEVILPELLGRYFTRNEGSAQIVYWCKCKGVDDGSPMISCDNDKCDVKWYHFQCVGLTEIPNEFWFCSRECQSMNI